jgi:hypothetical protein
MNNEVYVAAFAVRSKKTRLALLASTALVASFGSISGAFSNTVTVGGLPVADNSPAFIWVTLPVAPTNVVVDTQNVAGGGLNAVWITALTANTDVTVASGRTVTSLGWGVAVSSTTGNINIVNNGSITGGVAGIYTNPRFFPDGGNVNISGSGAVSATAGAAIYAEMDTGNVDINGFSAITGGTHGIRVWTGGTWTGNPGGNYNIGTVTPLGPITADGIGIETSQANAFGEGTTTIRATTVNAGSIGVNPTSTTGAIDVGVTGLITAGTHGILSSTTTGNITTRTSGINSTGFGIVTTTIGGVTNVADTVGINSANTGIWTTGATGNTIVSANNITSTANYGVFSTSTTGNNTISANIVNAATAGLYSTTTSGIIDMTATGLITAGTHGILAGTGTGNITTRTTGINSNAFGIVTTTVDGNTTVTDTAVINSVNTGIWTTGATGNTTVTANSVVSTGNYGIFSTSTSGNNIISSTGPITGASNGIFSVTSSGNNTLTGNGTSVVSGGIEGIYVNPTTSGNATISNYASITGDRAGIWTVAGSGTTSIQGNGPVTGNGNWGILSQAITGNINIGNITANNNIHGAIVGAEATTAGAGNVNVTNAAGMTIDGGTWGLITGTGTGLATTNNAGIIKTTPDLGAAGDPGPGFALWQKSGTGITNNGAGGRIIGSVATAGLAFTLNNNAGATWTPGLANTFATAADLVDNRGLINIRSGNTVMAGLENLRNQAGGVINMQYGPAATDTLTTLGFSPQAGSVLNLNVEPGAANGAGDSGGQGRGDTVIVAGPATPGGRSTINLASIGPAPTTLTGAIALVNTSGADVPAPAPGAQLTPSVNYTLGFQNLPLFGAKLKYTLVDEPNGGAFLVWQPNITAETMGAFFGGAAGSASAAGTAAGKFAGLGGLGGSPSSGAAGGVGDVAANSAGQQSTPAPSAGGGFKKPGSAIQGCGPTRQLWTVFMQGDLAQSSYKGGGSTNSSGGTFGVERDLSGLIGNGCSTTVAAGIFGTYGGSSTGSSSSTSQGLGAYLRASTSFGLYGAVIATFGRSETDMRNAIFGSTAKQNSNNQAFIGTIGYVHRFNGGRTWLDARGSFGLARSNGQGFTDTVGIVVDGTKDELRAFTGTLGLHHAFTPTTTGYIRAGVRQLESFNSATAFGITVSGKGRQTSAIAEIGLSSEIMKGVTLSAGGFGEQSKTKRTLGGNARLSIKF